jgi:hypothetical protein
VTRCSWCEREATRFVVADLGAPCCEDAACVAASAEVYDAVVDRRGSRPRWPPHLLAALDEARASAARELRGEPPSMEGWVLW